MTTIASEQDMSATVDSLAARLADAQERLAATRPEHARLRQERRDAFEAGRDTEPLDGRLARLDRDAQDLEAIIERVMTELATANAAQLQQDIAAARLDRTRAEVAHCEVGSAAVTRVLEVMREELGKEATASAELYEANERLGRLDGQTPMLVINVVFDRLRAVASGLEEDGRTKDLVIELESARTRLAALEGASSNA